MLDWLNSLKAKLTDTTANAKIEDELKKLEAKRAKLLDTYLEELISKDDYAKKYKKSENDINEKKNLLAPVDENEDIKSIEKCIENIDSEIDKFTSTSEFETSKTDWLLEKTKKITVLENRDLILEVDQIAGAIIAGKNFLSYVPESMQIPDGRISFPRHGTEKRNF